MHYTQFFQNLRNAKGLTIEKLARQARRHRNTVLNVEAGRRVKFKTIVELMTKMGYPMQSEEMKTVALLWLEDASGIPFSRPDVAASARKALSDYRATNRQAIRHLDTAILEAGLDAAQIELLAYAAGHPEMLLIISSIRDLVNGRGPRQEISELKVADEKGSG
jgi:transcriptional regulator with XRE-family HTH domain